MEPTPRVADQRFLSRVTEASIRLALLAFLVAWCLTIVMPFVGPVVWGAVLAIAVAPLHARLSGWLGGRRKLAAALIASLGLTLLCVPVVLLFGSAVEGGAWVVRRIQAGTLTLPPPGPGVAEWPVIGEQLAEQWALAAEDVVATARTFAPQLEALAAKLMGALAGLGVDIAGFAFAILLTGLFLAVGARVARPAEAFGTRVAGDRGRELVRDSVRTIRSVAQGVVGVAAIQSVASGVGMLVVGVPAAGLWALLVLIVAVVQLPPLLVLGPVAIYAFNTQSTAAAVGFLVFALLISGSDAVLKPMLLGRGVKVPMPVILIGAIGGMVSSGILGLFLGPVVLSVGYRLFTAWMDQGAAQGETGAES